MRCEDVARQATDYTEGALEAVRRAELQAHLTGCDGCRSYVEGLQSVARSVPVLARAVVAPAQVDALAAAFRQRMALSVGAAQLSAPSLPLLTNADPQLTAAVLITAIASVIGAFATRHRAPFDTAGSAYLTAIVVASFGIGLIWLSRRRGFLAASIASVVALGLAFGNQPAAFNVALGVKCSLHIWVTAAVAGGALLWSRAGKPLSASSFVGVTSAAALCGDAALHVACPDVHSLAHPLIFHAGGVASAALLAVLVTRMARFAAVFVQRPSA